MYNNSIDDHEENTENERRQSSSDINENQDIVGSPADSQRSNSSGSNRQQQYRVVELLPTAENQPNQWSISRHFYDIDVTDNPENPEEEDEDGADDDNDPDYQLEMEVPEEYDDEDDDEDDDDDEMYEADEFNRLNDMVLIEPHHDDQSSNESGEDQLDANYDTTLPVGHHYLGEDLEESRGREVLVEGTVTKIPLINLRHVVLFPNQVLPVTTSNLSPLVQSCLRRCVDNRLTTIGIISEPFSNLIGTTAEIRNYTYNELDNELRIIMEGRQRFKLLSSPFDTVSSKADVLILYEITLGSPIPKIPSLLKYAPNTVMSASFLFSKHPKWVFKKYDAKNIVIKILNQIKDWCNPDLTKNSGDFSYWVAANLPISNLERMKILSFDCTESRLLWLLDKLENSNCFCCSNCNNVICKKEDVFSMSRSGPQCSFVNPSGSIHDTLTVRIATGLLLEYDWSEEFTWFPGYKWRSAYCGLCNRHIGWCYNRIKPGMIPKRFFGLSRSNVKLSTVILDSNPPQRQGDEIT